MQTETRRIVVVDDDELFRESLGANLMDEGFEVIDFAEGRAVIDFFAAKNDADIVLLDWKMPGMDGLEVLRQLRRADIQVPIPWKPPGKGWILVGTGGIEPPTSAVSRQRSSP
jgi:two-component system response regulator ChvI